MPASTMSSRVEVTAVYSPERTAAMSRGTARTRAQTDGLPGGACPEAWRMACASITVRRVRRPTAMVSLLIRSPQATGQR